MDLVHDVLKSISISNTRQLQAVRNDMVRENVKKAQVLM